MQKAGLDLAVLKFKTSMEAAISTAHYGGRTYENGQRAKEALIRSGSLINLLHEVVKVSLSIALDESRRTYAIYPPVGSSYPELPITGLIKAKNQDIVVLVDGDVPVGEVVAEGALKGLVDPVGQSVSARGMAIGVRSQLSSVGKNFDTLMERAFAETVNVRLRLPTMTMGEVYVLPVVEYDEEAMLRNRIEWRRSPVPITRFVRTFLAISGRDVSSPEIEQLYKYDRSALVLVDFRPGVPRVFYDMRSLAIAGLLPRDPGFTDAQFQTLSPSRFGEDLIASHERRHPRR